MHAGLVRIGVVIPARDEELLIGACLDSIETAQENTSVATSIYLVADGCLDRTVEIARMYRGVRVIEIESSNVGTARGIGSRKAILDGCDWLANTDADSTVPPNWLQFQAELANRRTDVMIGTVRPRLADMTAESITEWMATHTPGQPNGHVHGANLGIRTSAYMASGGFLPLPEHEDNDLVLRLHRFRTVATDVCEVETSGRRVGRTPGGYAAYLRRLELEAAASLVI